LFIFIVAIRAVNPKSAELALNLLDLLIQSSQLPSDIRDLHNELEHILRDTLRRVSDPNLKIRVHAE
jgi:hypothetical protein